MLLEKAPEMTPAGTLPPTPYERPFELSVSDKVSVSDFVDDILVLKLEGNLVGIRAGQLEPLYAVSRGKKLPHDTHVYWMPRSLLKWVPEPIPILGPATAPTDVQGMSNLNTPGIGLAVVVLFGIVWALD